MSVQINMFGGCRGAPGLCDGETLARKGIGAAMASDVQSRRTLMFPGKRLPEGGGPRRASKRGPRPCGVGFLGRAIGRRLQLMTGEASVGQAYEGDEGHSRNLYAGGVPGLKREIRRRGLA